MRSLEQIRSDNWKSEHYAAIDFFERTGRDYYKLSPTEQRKILENWKEDHQ